MSGKLTLVTSSTEQIAENIRAVKERIDSAARQADRDPSEIRLMAVTKTQPAEKIVAAYKAGIRSFGENRVQEFAGKQLQLRDLTGATFALIGRLQSNKANKAIDLFSEVHSVDSFRLAERLNAGVERSHKQPLPCAIEINTGDPAKAGLHPESSELQHLLSRAPDLPHIRIRGLMTIPPFDLDPESARPYFERLRKLRDTIVARQFPRISMELLSMGMSHDFEVAIAEGSTCVRIGTAIFGERV